MRTLKFRASDSPDVVKYKLYVSEVPEEVGYDSESVDLDNQPDADNYIVVNLAELSIMTTKDGIYNLGVTAVDDAGNESSMSKAADVPLDFVAPNPPGALELS